MYMYTGTLPVITFCASRKHSMMTAVVVFTLLSVLEMVVLITILIITIVTRQKPFEGVGLFSGDLWYITEFIAVKKAGHNCTAPIAGLVAIL